MIATWIADLILEARVFHINIFRSIIPGVLSGYYYSLLYKILFLVHDGLLRSC